MYNVPSNGKAHRSQSSLELLITLSFGLIILLPIVVLAFVQIAASSSTLSTTEAQQVASKLASVAQVVGSQGPPAKQLVLIQIPQGVSSISIGSPSGGVGHEIVFVVSTDAGPSDVVAYTPTNVSGSLTESEGTYLVIVEAENQCPTAAGLSCVYIKNSQ
ncbi:MAG: hypothetical protein QXN59_02200 [Candidatus Micrarchaeaceae archaeon]